MSAADESSLALGFMAVRAASCDRLRGGYLLTTPFGRPIEFHYTTELVIRRPHRVLYGEALEPYVFSHIIALPLFARAAVSPHLVIVTSRSFLDLRPFVPVPVVQIGPANEIRATFSAPQITAHWKYASDVAAYESANACVAAGFDWLEPFQRIEQALAEVSDPLLLDSA
jgi:hypothetical protein